ncbi:putative F-box/LRR-repeat protein 9 isoform X2 [Salvia hispanica]|nr:putative F-box/LRR-repeat protein 9 isoform X2 [Salvia hispanica]
MSTHSKIWRKPSFPAFPPSPFTPPFDELFSLYHSTPLKNNPHVGPPPGSMYRSASAINPPRFGSFQGPSICTIHDYFDFYATPHDERLRLLRLCNNSFASIWLHSMSMWKTNVLPMSVVASSSDPPPSCIDLPRDVTAEILQRLGAEGMLTSAQKVCTTWWKVCKDPALWRVIDFSNPRQGIFNDEYNVMCRRAVDRSQGQLVDLTIQYFGDDALLDYIVHRSPNLKRIKLGTCFFISGYCARRMVAKLPHLKELHLTLRPGLGACDIEVIGKSCPMLKSFSLNGSN